MLKRFFITGTDTSVGENGGFPRIATSVSLPGKNGCGI
ncbi:Uncharacterised protein [Escherichia coli]|uniref:Uncharacterized protein n=1 Tax=Escherichia coli TaxID=562 RepID=A0A485JGJ4_ECOLX|nr:Uncharacterised protein [Escherichia coli]